MVTQQQPADEPGAPSARRPATDAEARALASGLRLQILRMTLDEPMTNQQIAERLGRNPASVLHHVRTLVDTGFLAAGEPRRGTRGAREVPYRATRHSWYLETPAGDRGMLEAFLTEFDAAPPEQRNMSRLGLRLTDDELEELHDRLAEVLDDFAERPPSPQGRPWSLFLAVHPDTSRR